MRILVVMDPIERVNIDKDTTFGFMLAAQARGHELFYCNLEHLSARGGDGWAHVASLEVEYDHHAFHRLGPWVDARLADFDSIWMRKDPPVDRAYLHATHLLDLAGDALVVNNPTGVRYANEKIYALQFPEFCPETRVTRSIAGIKAWLAEKGEPLIVKPVDGHGGAGIFLLRPDDRNVSSILETLTEEGERWVMVQQYIPEAREGDKRIIMIDGRPLGAILRTPREDDNRGNIHVGGTVSDVDLTERDKAICAAVGPRLVQDGLWFVGLDVIGGYLTEINVTSPTGIREVEKLTGTDLGAAYVEWVESAVAARTATGHRN